MDKPAHILLTNGEWNRYLDFMISDKEPSTKQLKFIADQIYLMPTGPTGKRMFPYPDFRSPEQQAEDAGKNAGVDRKQAEAERLLKFHQAMADKCAGVPTPPQGRE